MFNFILRFFSFGMYTFLRLAVAVTSNAYFTAMDIFIIMADVLRTNIALPDSDSASNTNRNSSIRQIIFNNYMRPHSSLSHTYTQTEEDIALTSHERERSSNTDVFIYNLDASKQITITHKNINSQSMNVNSDDQGQSSKTKVKHSRIESIKYDCSTVSFVESVYSESSEYSSSNMSIENEVSNGQILQFSHSTKEAEGYDRSSKSTEKTLSHNCENKSEETTDGSDDFECDSQKDLETRDQNSAACIQKTSSPIRKSAKLSLVDPCNQLENTSNKGKFEPEDVSSETSDESSKLVGEETYLNSFENTLLFNNAARRRLSLPTRFNYPREAVLQFEAIKNKLKETITNSRHEKSTREIKYPLLGETFLATDEESKEIFSCSSYESLPVSEHFRSTFEKSALFPSHKDFTNASTPDFSSVDEFVEAFNKLKSTLSISELIKKKHPVPLSSTTESVGEVRRLVRARSCEMVETKKPQESDTNSLIEVNNNKAILKDTLEEQEIPSKNSDVGDTPSINSDLNSIDFKADECEVKGETFSENIYEIITSMFEKIDNELNTSAKCINDQSNPHYESNEGKYFESGPCRSNLTEPLQFQQDQTIIEISSMRPFKDHNGIYEEIENGVSINKKLAELNQDENSENMSFKETNSQTRVVYEEKTVTESQNREPIQKISEFENIECKVRLDSDKTSKFLLSKVTSDMKVEALENGEKQYQSFTSVTDADNEFKMADESIRLLSGEDDCVSTTLTKDNLEGNDVKRVISTACYRNDSIGNDKFFSFVEETSFYNDSNLDDSTWVSKELACK